MARRRYRRYYKRKGKHWSTRLTSINVSQSAAPNVTFFIFRTLATNPAQDDNTVSQRFTVKNVHCNIAIEAGNPGFSSGIENLQHYILFIPQGFTLTENTPFEHPEWIMAHRFLGSPQPDDNPGYAPAVIRSRLARKLDTGDRVVYLLLGGNTSTESQTISVNGLVKLNTKAN